MKSLLLLGLLVAGVSASLSSLRLFDGHRQLHSSMQALMSRLQGTPFSSEMKQELHRSQQELIKHLEPFFHRSGIRIMNPKAYHTLLHNMMFLHSRSIVNTSKALDGMAESAVGRLSKYHLLKELHQMGQLQRKLIAFFHSLHHEISNDVRMLLAKHGVHLGMHHVHFLMHLSARAIVSGRMVKEAVIEKLKVVQDSPLPPDQQRKLEAAAVDLAHTILIKVKSRLHAEIRAFLAKSIRPEATHPHFLASAAEHMHNLMHKCPRSMRAMLGKRYHHYKVLESKAFGTKAAQRHLHLLLHLHRGAGPVTEKHMDHVMKILRRYGHHPKPSVIHYVGAVHLRPHDFEHEHRPWYACFLRRMHGLVRIAWLVFAVLLGGALLGTAVWLIIVKCRGGQIRTKRVVVVKPKNEKKKPLPQSECPKLPYVSLVEEKVPDSLA